MKSLKIWKGVLILPLLAGTFLLAGCGTGRFGVGGGLLTQSGGTGAFETNMVDVKINVLLEKEYVQKAFSAPQGMMKVLQLSSFEGTTVVLVGFIREDEKPEDTRTFSKQLLWGEQSFNIRAPKNAEIQFTLGSGFILPENFKIGSVKIGKEATQTVVIKLTATGASIK